MIRAYDGKKRKLATQVPPMPSVHMRVASPCHNTLVHLALSSLASCCVAVKPPWSGCKSAGYRDPDAAHGYRSPCVVGAERPKAVQPTGAKHIATIRGQDGCHGASPAWTSTRCMLCLPSAGTRSSTGLRKLRITGNACESGRTSADRRFGQVRSHDTSRHIAMEQRSAGSPSSRDLAPMGGASLGRHL